MNLRRIELGQRECTEIIRGGGLNDGKRLGYVIRNENRWEAFGFGIRGDLLLMGIFETYEAAVESIPL